MPTDYNVLKHVPLFEGLSKNELEKLLSSINYTEIQFHKGDILARTDEPCNRTTVLLSGRIKGDMTDSTGKVVKLEDIQAPGALSLPFLFGRGEFFPLQITALEDGRAITISTTAILKLLTMSDILLKNYLHLSTQIAYRIIKRLQVMAFMTIRRKISLYLLDQAERVQSNHFKLTLTHIALAEYFGVSRQALEREMRNMASEGLIAVEGKTITILSKSKLEFLVKF